MLVQLVEIPGLIGGATDDRGGGRALLGVLRSADAIVYCARAGGDPAELATVRAEVAPAGIDKPAILAATRADEATPRRLARLARRVPGPDVVRVSVLDEASLDAFRDGGLGARPGSSGSACGRAASTDDEPLALDRRVDRRGRRRPRPPRPRGDLRGARVWGPSARFDGQRVGRDHLVSDGDSVEILR